MRYSLLATLSVTVCAVSAVQRYVAREAIAGDPAPIAWPPINEINFSLAPADPALPGFGQQSGLTAWCRSKAFAFACLDC
jgi:hypothetical protein